MTLPSANPARVSEPVMDASRQIDPSRTVAIRLVAIALGEP